MTYWKCELVFVIISFTISGSTREVNDIRGIIDLQGENFFAESQVLPLPKCCPPGRRLNSQLERCEEDTLNTLTPFPTEWLKPWGGGFAPNAGCDASDILRLSSEDALRRVQIASNGSLLLTVNATTEQKVNLSREKFCADASSRKGSPWAMLVCPCGHVPCVRKCCPRGHILRVKEKTEARVDAKCEESKEVEWMPVINGTHLLLWGVWPIGCGQGFTRLPASWQHDPPTEEDIKEQKISDTFINSLDHLKENDVCVDLERNVHGLLSESSLYCASSAEPNVEDIVVAAVCSLGAIALVLVILTLVLLPEQRSTAFGKMVACYASSLLLSFIFSISMVVAPDMSGGICFFIFTAVQYVDLAAAFWLNAMCWDMGSSFRILQVPIPNAQTGKERFQKYSLYAWSGPTLICLVMIVMQFSLPTGHHWRPIRWYLGCQYTTSTFQFLFYYGPMLIVLLTNFILLIYITWKIRKLHKNIAMLNKSVSYGLAEKKVMMYMRLLWSVGVIEALVENVSWMIASPVDHFHISMAAILSRAFCLFAMVCCKERVLKQIRKLLGIKRPSRLGINLVNDKTRKISDTNNTFFSSLRTDSNATN